MEKVRLVSTKNPGQTKVVARRHVALLLKLGLYRYPDAPAAVKPRPDKPPRKADKAVTAEGTAAGERATGEYKRRDMRAEE